MAVASPYAVFKAGDLNWFGPTPAQRPPNRWPLAACSTEEQQRIRSKRNANALITRQAMVQGELFQLA